MRANIRKQLRKSRTEVTDAHTQTQIYTRVRRHKQPWRSALRWHEVAIATKPYRGGDWVCAARREMLAINVDIFAFPGGGFVTFWHDVTGIWGFPPPGTVYLTVCHSHQRGKDSLASWFWGQKTSFLKPCANWGLFHFAIFFQKWDIPPHFSVVNFSLNISGSGHHLIVWILKLLSKRLAVCRTWNEKIPRATCTQLMGNNKVTRAPKADWHEMGNQTNRKNLAFLPPLAWYKGKLGRGGMPL